MIDLVFQSPTVGVVEATADMLDPENDQNLTIMEYKALPEGASTDNHVFKDLLEGLFFRKIETSKSAIGEFANGLSLSVHWRNQANDSVGTWFAPAGSVSVP
tara:strand:+ start:1509 stop:1814 length:306 start_codon:yes stop_codon:yes gene_type:complete